MPAEYDLVILGGTLEGRLAALSAVGYGAGVALIETPGVFGQRQQARYLRQGLQQLAEGREQQAVGEWFALNQVPRANLAAANFDWQALVGWSAIAADTQLPMLSVEALSISGVDVIFAVPKQISSRLVVVAADRVLRSRAILVACGTVACAFAQSQPEPSTAAPLAEQVATDQASITGIEQLLQLKTLPVEISILGDSFEAVTWAQALSTLGVNVTLASDRFLHHESGEMRAVVRSHLIAAGIRLVSAADGHDLASVVLSLGRQQTALSLPDFLYQPRDRRPPIDIRTSDRPFLPVNSRLQTAHPRIFACGSIVRGRNPHLSLAKYETQIAVRNALFIPTKRVDRRRTVKSTYHFASAGIVPEFAKQGRSPKKPYKIWTAAVPNSADLSQVSPLPFYCQLICDHDRLQSVSLVGRGAGELVEAIASMIGKPIAAIAATSAPTPPAASSLMDAVQVAAEKAVQASSQSAFSTRWQPGHWRRDWAENWFNWRRSRQR